MKFQGIKVAVADLGEESPLPYHHHLIKSRQGKQKKPPPPAPLPLLRSRSGSPLKPTPAGRLPYILGCMGETCRRCLDEHGTSVGERKKSESLQE